MAAVDQVSEIGVGGDDEGKLPADSIELRAAADDKKAVGQPGDPVAAQPVEEPRDRDADPELLRLLPDQSGVRLLRSQL